jgi:hypothetical protein
MGHVDLLCAKTPADRFEVLKAKPALVESALLSYVHSMCACQLKAGDDKGQTAQIAHAANELAFAIEYSTDRFYAAVLGTSAKLELADGFDDKCIREEYQRSKRQIDGDLRAWLRRRIQGSSFPSDVG